MVCHLSSTPASTPDHRSLSADACHFIGRTHAVCQDYAAAGSLGPAAAYALVSDGCSSSADTDVGARLLARSAIRSLAEHGRLELASTLRRAALAARALGLPTTSLDATLLVAVAAPDRLRATCLGDGVIAARHRDGQIESWEVRFSGNAPGYPSYALDPARHARWRERHGMRTVIHRRGVRVVNLREERVSSELSMTLDLDSHDLDLLVLLSDGATSFGTTTGGPQPTLDEILTELLAVKTTTGAFLERRCRRFLGKTCSRRGWRHDDDLAVAAIAFKGDR